MFQEDGRSHYQSFLLRLWRPDDLSPWQGSLQDTADGEVHHFADLDSLWAYLVQVTGSSTDPPPEKTSA
ncbi:MAG: hypothetical protein U0X20_10890 [Caldilineaceae bacterium]